MWAGGLSHYSKTHGDAFAHISEKDCPVSFAHVQSVHKASKMDVGGGPETGLPHNTNTGLAHSVSFGLWFS